MEVAFFDVHQFEKAAFAEAFQAEGFSVRWIDARCGESTAALAEGANIVCGFVNDVYNASVLERLHKGGVRFLALRSAGFNHVDLAAAARLGIAVARVPAYSPNAVAEHALGLLMSLNRQFHRAYNRVREHNFSIEGLVGYDLCGKTVGVVGTGKIGAVMCSILRGFGCRVLAVDSQPSEALKKLGVEYVSWDQLLPACDILTLHVPLTPQTLHLINRDTLSKVKKGVVLINTSRGRLVDTDALLEALRSGVVSAAGLDVYEEEEGLFFQDLSEKPLGDERLALLLTFPNVLVTCHQAFLTKDALKNIRDVTIGNILDYRAGRTSPNIVSLR